MKYEEIHEHKKHLLLQCISGSKAYGLNTASSDTDIRGIFMLPFSEYYGLNYTEQVANESNDIVYYEFKRFMELLSRNNPNILELLSTPEDCILFKSPLLDLLKPEIFLSKLCRDTFAGYAMSQIKKAKGLNKKIVNPVDENRKTIDDFCFVTHEAGSLPLNKWLEKNAYKQEECGLIAINHFKEMYALFHEQQADKLVMSGIHSGENANDVKLSSVPKGIKPLAYLTFNKDGYSMYCKDYREYWDWVAVRNDSRYQSTLDHGKNYDAKNMMHTFRLLNMAEEIATLKRIVVRRPDREFLLRIKSGEFQYEDLMQMAKDKLARVEEAFDKSDLPELPDVKQAEELLVRVRDEYYKIK